MYLVATPSSCSSAMHVCAILSVMAAFQRACTMPMRRSRPSISVWGPLSASCMKGPSGAGGCDEAGDFEPVAHHARHASRAAEQLHLRDAQLAQDLGAD